MNRLHLLAATLATTLFLSTAEAEIRLPALIGHHMVMQQDLENPIWGWAEPGTDVTVLIKDQSHQAKADESGKWMVKLAPMTGSHQPLRMTIQTKTEKVNLSNILVGEVWICSGQSNMQWSVSQSNDSDLETATANYPRIRLITVPQTGTQELQEDFKGQWEVCTPETVGQFSAVGYFFGRQLHQTLDVPIGLIDNAWGGSAAEAWVARDVLEADPRFSAYLGQWKEIESTFDLDKAIAEWRAKVKEAKAAGKPSPPAPRDPLAGQHRPGNLWAGVLNPLIGYGIRGTIWYQGESNAPRAYQYEDLFSLMITEWRKAWGIGDFPFYWVQLADYMAEKEEPAESAWAELREAQSNTLALPNTGQAVIYDLGEGRDIHPRDKQNVAKRLARLALAKDYGYPIFHQSASYSTLEAGEGRITVIFENIGSGLYTFDTTDVIGFTIAGEDKVWHNAVGKLVDNDKVEVSSEAVPIPVAVRYAWADNPVANLRSKEGLPVTPFRTDDWPLSTEPKPE